MHKYKARPILFSSVNGGPLARLRNALKKRQLDSKLFALFEPQSWRKLFKAGQAGRILARGLSFGIYPLASLGRALYESSLAQSGRGFERPVLVTTTNPFFLPHFLVATKALHRCSVLALIYDMYPDALEASGHGQAQLSKLIEAANRYMIAHADGVVYLGPKMRQSAEERYGKNPATWILPTGACRSEFDPPSGVLEQELENWLKGRTVISYVGNLGLMHDVDTMARGIPKYLDGLDKEARQRVAFVFAASGPGIEKLQKHFGNAYDDVLRFVGPLEDGAWAALMARSDLSLVTLKQAAHATCAPSKAYSAIAAGAALLAVAPQNSDLAALVEGRFGQSEHLSKGFPASEDGQNACGIVVKANDDDAFIDALKVLVDEENRKRFALAIERAAASNDIPHLAENWQQCFEEVLKTAPKTWAEIAYALSKRSLDILASTLGLLAISPLLAVTALGVYLELGRPIIFSQTRPGRRAKVFKLYKFRSMRPSATESIDPSKDGERLTAFGKKIRALSLDELPSLFNVLQGDMSLVGPRPLLMSYLERYDKEQIRRQWVKPGITGWSQVKGRNALSWEDKFALDLYYVDNASFLFDIKILLMTFSTVLKRSGISHKETATMPEFMGKTKDDSKA